jgi:hypothetical protein
MVAALSVLGAAGAATACSVPVFRYALENWRPDLYGVYILHDRPLSKEAEQAAARLEAGAVTGEGLANLRVVRVDVTKEKSAVVAALRKEAKTLPRIVVAYPWSEGPLRPVWSGPVTAAAADLVLDSPARGKLGTRLVAGDTAVWVLVECGDAKNDDAVVAGLRKMLEEVPKKVEVPDVDAETGDAGVRTLPVRFSVLRVSRGDAKEAFFLATLLCSEPDLGKYAGEPVFFPVFGGGRSLYALVGKGINVENVLETTDFLIGPCGCQVKRLNPGTDLLLAAAWDSVEPLATETTELPPLAGLPAGGTGGAKPDAPGEAKPTFAPPPPAKLPTPRSFFSLPFVLAVSLGSVLVLAGGMALLAGRKKEDAA